MKKLKFKDFLLKKLIIFSVIEVLLTVGLFGAQYFFFHTIFEMQSMITSSEAKGRINDTATTNAHRSWTLALYFDYIMNKDMGVDSAGVIYDPETNEIIATSEFNCFALIPKEYFENNKGRFLKNKSEEYINILEEYANEGYEVKIDISEIYLDGDEFYPGKVIISRLDDSPMGSVIGEPEEYDFTPENASEYEKIDYQDFELAFGTLSDSTAMKDLLANYSSLHTVENYTYYTFYSEDTIKIDDKEYVFASLHYMDFWGFYGVWCIVTSALPGAVAIIIVIFEQRSKYKKYLTQYEIDEYRRNMTNALAHDLKSPLTAIYGYAENLKNNVHTEKKDYYADAVLENVQYMNEIITNTLDLAKLEIGDKGLKKEKVDITALAEELYGKYKPQAESRNISFTMNGEAVVSADRKMLSQAVENLISNAVKYTTDGGEIVITADEKTFAISNTCDNNLNTEKLENPFEKADASRSNRKGSGIGLSIVKNIAMLHKFGFETKSENGIFTAKITF